MTTRNTILQAALERFARTGYLGSSIQQIADDVGTSKSSVLYHFESKEVLLEAAMQPAIDAMSALVAELPQLGPAKLEAVPALATAFVDVLMAHSAAVSVFVTQRGALRDVAVIGRANALVDELASILVHEAPSARVLTRVSIGLAGVAFILGDSVERERLDSAEMRELLIDTLLELCLPQAQARLQERTR